MDGNVKTIFWQKGCLKSSFDLCVNKNSLVVREERGKGRQEKMEYWIFSVDGFLRMQRLVRAKR